LKLGPAETPCRHQVDTWCERSQVMQVYFTES
jgi:hypothetical protein